MKPGKLQQLPTDLILDPERPLRSDISPESLTDLVRSIKQIGIIEPLIVHPVDDKYQVIAGHRRLRSAEMADLVMVPCLVVEVVENEVEIIKAHENLVRSEISAIDWANHLLRLKQQSGVSNAKLGEMLGMSEPWIKQHLDILRYDGYLLEAVDSGKVSFTSARELSGIKDPRTREVYTKHAISGGVTPALAARWRQQANTPRLTDTPQTADTLNPNIEIAPPNPYLTCAVCNQNIPLGEEVSLVVHQTCKPQ